MVVAGQGHRGVGQESGGMSGTQEEVIIDEVEYAPVSWGGEEEEELVFQPTEPDHLTEGEAMDLLRFLATPLDQTEQTWARLFAKKRENPVVKLKKKKRWVKKRTIETYPAPADVDVEAGVGEGEGEWADMPALETDPQLTDQYKDLLKNVQRYPSLFQEIEYIQRKECHRVVRKYQKLRGDPPPVGDITQESFDAYNEDYRNLLNAHRRLVAYSSEWTDTIMGNIIHDTYVASRTNIMRSVKAAILSAVGKYKTAMMDAKDEVSRHRLKTNSVSMYSAWISSDFISITNEIKSGHGAELSSLDMAMGRHLATIGELADGLGSAAVGADPSLIAVYQKMKLGVMQYPDVFMDVEYIERSNVHVAMRLYRELRESFVPEVLMPVLAPCFRLNRIRLNAGPIF